MPRLAANLSTLFPELPFLERAVAAARAGFTAVECQFPYEVPAKVFAQQLAASGLACVLFNGPPGDPSAGERGTACLPGREAEFAAGIDIAMEYLLATGCRQLHVMAGLVPQGHDREDCLARYVRNIALAADRLRTIGATVLIEPINTRVDVPGYLLDGTVLALACIDRAARDNIRLQYDCYHMQIMEGDLLRSLERLLPHIGHIQIADNPGRHEPGTGEINYDELLPALDALGYRGWVGCEYVPAGETTAGLGWSRAFLTPAPGRYPDQSR